MRGPQSDWTDALRRHAERRLHFALSRFSQSISLATVRILSDAGTTGGLDKTCRIVVYLLPKGRILVEDTQKDLYSAIDQVAEHASRAVRRALDRERDWETAPAPSKAAGGSRS